MPSLAKVTFTLDHKFVSALLYLFLFLILAMALTSFFLVILHLFIFLFSSFIDHLMSINCTAWQRKILNRLVELSLALWDVIVCSASQESCFPHFRTWSEVIEFNFQLNHCRAPYHHNHHHHYYFDLSPLNKTYRPLASASIRSLIRFALAPSVQRPTRSEE